MITKYTYLLNKILTLNLLLLKYKILFKSIQHKLLFYTVLLVLLTASITYLILEKQYLYLIPIGFIFIITFNKIRLHYKKYNENILFLLNALENGDYSFRFSSTKLSIREKEFNKTLNRIKEILTNARKEVIENEKFLSLIVESVSTGIIIMDENGYINTVNKATLDILGLPVFTHVNQLSFINVDLPNHLKNMNPDDSFQIPVINERENYQVSLKLSKLKIKNKVVKVITLNNIGSELEAKEMESWTRLIRVMTHEIMNSIAPITSISETMTNVLKEHSNNQNIENTIFAFQTINTTAKGLLSFVESYRKFVKIPKPEKQDFNIFDLVKNIISLEQNILKVKNIEVKLTSNNNDAKIYADQSLLMQVLVNIIKNAIEAVYDESIRKININIKYTESLKTIIDISNSGKHISEDVLPHIFVPFFTTKNSGTGIGLSISRYIIRLHGGKLIHYISEENYTVFRIII